MPDLIVDLAHAYELATDAFVIADLPDATSAASIALTVSAGGEAGVQTTVLMTPEEVDAAAS